MKFLFFILLLSGSAFAYDATPYEESQDITQSGDLVTGVKTCVTVGEGTNVPTMTTTLMVKAKRTSVVFHQKRLCHKTGWLSHSCTGWKTVAKSAPQVSMITKLAFNETKAKLPQNNPYGEIQNHHIAEEMIKQCENVRDELVYQIRNRQH
ncbi:MAG: hypothetical protein ACJ76H_07010 [Bacteriovoracaceae bacterium]